MYLLLKLYLGIATIESSSNRQVCEVVSSLIVVFMLFSYFDCMGFSLHNSIIRVMSSSIHTVQLYIHLVVLVYVQ